MNNLRLGIVVLLLGNSSACTTVNAPVSAGQENAGHLVVTSSHSTQFSGKPEFYTVAKGDTLFAIAWRYGHDYKSLASWNLIKPPFVIYPGQVIQLRPVKRQRSIKPSPVPEKHARSPAKPIAKPQIGSRSTPAANVAHAAVRWQWPVRGKLLKPSSPTMQKGISISGRAGQKIVAAATGKVVYSGSGLRGYGNLIIIKHNDTYLSAYAHNRELIVKEGEAVKSGQQISTMGTGSKGAPVLHFEIRKNGRPIDPLVQLPRS